MAANRVDSLRVASPPEFVLLEFPWEREACTDYLYFGSGSGRWHNLKREYISPGEKASGRGALDYPGDHLPNEFLVTGRGQLVVEQ